MLKASPDDLGLGQHSVRQNRVEVVQWRQVEGFGDTDLSDRINPIRVARSRYRLCVLSSAVLQQLPEGRLMVVVGPSEEVVVDLLKGLLANPSGVLETRKVHDPRRAGGLKKGVDPSAVEVETSANFFR